MIQYIDRKTGALCDEKVYGKEAIQLFYGDGLLSRILYHTVLPVVARIPWLSSAYGWLQKSRFSREKVARFIEDYGVDASEFEESEFSTFNDFFIRKLKKERRPIAAGAPTLAAPADGRYLVYPTFSDFVVKGQEFSLPKFLGDDVLARRFEDGAMLIARLCPVDYHRFHFPCDGVVEKARLINGPLYSVNLVALKRWIAILSENKRMVTEIESKEFGTVLYVEIGATAVGTIRQTFQPGTVEKGAEKGYFEFGGSCLVLLFERGRVQFDSDLIANTQRGVETLCRMGERVGER